MNNQRIFLPFLCSFLISVTAFVPVPMNRNGIISLSPSTSLYAAKDDEKDELKIHRLAEFINLDPLPKSDKRLERMEQEKQNKLKFVDYGNNLWNLRSSIENLSNDLISAIQKGDKHVEDNLRETLVKAEQRDPELVYKTEVELMENAAAEKRFEDETEHKKNALNARSCLPQLNFEGLWVGKYGDNDYELINITYAGDTMIAYKVTGDQNVPRGEITFQADLNPTLPRKIVGDSEGSLDPIVLTDKASEKWGTKQLQRYPGLGRVAEENFKNAQWMEGQLIIISENYFSFAWTPIEHQIFFGRPSDEMVLKMLKDSGASSLREKVWDEPPKIDDDIKVWKDFASHCLERTKDIIEEDLDGNEDSCIWDGVDAEESYFE